MLGGDSQRSASAPVPAVPVAVAVAVPVAPVAVVAVLVVSLVGEVEVLVVVDVPQDDAGGAGRRRLLRRGCGLLQRGPGRGREVRHRLCRRLDRRGRGRGGDDGGRTVGAGPERRLVPRTTSPPAATTPPVTAARTRRPGAVRVGERCRGGEGTGSGAVSGRTAISPSRPPTSAALGRAAASSAVIAISTARSGGSRCGGPSGRRGVRATADSSAAPPYSRRPVSASSRTRPRE